MGESPTQDPNKENVYSLLVDVFETCISEADLTDSIANLTELYASFSGQGFESSFEDILMLTLSESKRSTDVQKIFRFISDFLVSLDNKFKSEHAKKSKKSKRKNDDDPDAVHPLLEYMFNVLENWSQAANYVIRFRSCQLLYMIFTNILDIGIGEIDVNTFEKIQSLIETRRRDVSANVRANTALLAKFFQDPSDHNDPMIAALCWQLQNDPNPRVRQNIIDVLAACEETIIPITRRFLHDKNMHVRNAALLHICHRISPRCYTTQHRILILNQCFIDSSSVVRNNAEKKLIPMWFRAYGDKLCAFFQSLRVGSECLDKLPFCKDLIRLLFKLVKISQILVEIDLDPETALPKSLNAEKIYVWRSFFLMAYQQEKLKKFIPKQSALAEFITKNLKEPQFETDDASSYNELIAFTMDILDLVEDEASCESLPSLAIDLMKNLFVPREVIPYAVAFYCEFAPKETTEIHNELLEVVRDLLKFSELSTGVDQKKLIQKCMDIFCEVLAQESIAGSSEIICLKDELVLTNFDSEDEDIRIQAFRALSLYCLLDLEDAKQLWPFLEKALYESTPSEKENAAKGLFDILKCHGCKLFEVPDGENNPFEEAVDRLLTHLLESTVDVNMVIKAIFKLYLSHHTYSPDLMGRLVLLMFHPNKGTSTKTIISNFMQLYGETKEEAECLNKSFLIIINILFNANKTDPYHKVSIKAVAHQLIEFAKMYEESKNFEIQEKFKDLLAVKLTHKFLKRPWRLPALDLQDVVENIVPKDIDNLIKLKANVKMILEGLNSAVFQKNPFSKKNVKFFNTYLKKIQAAMDSASDDKNNSPQSNSTPVRRKQNHSSENNLIKSVDIDQVQIDQVSSESPSQENENSPQMNTTPKSHKQIPLTEQNFIKSIDLDKVQILEESPEQRSPEISF